MVDLDSIPDRLQSELSVSGCASDLDLTSSSSPQTSHDTTGPGRGHDQHRSSPLGIQPSSSGTASDAEINLPIAERKNFQVLVVEDK